MDHLPAIGSWFLCDLGDGPERVQVKNLAPWDEKRPVKVITQDGITKWVGMPELGPVEGEA